MTDRELLEAAARAAGLRGVVVDNPITFRVIHPGGAFDHWNPLEDDGQALRLAVALRILIEPCRTMARQFVEVHAHPSGRGDCAGNEPLGAGDDAAATRRAIVRAAAALATSAACPPAPLA